MVTGGTTVFLHCQKEREDTHCYTLLQLSQQLLHTTCIQCIHLLFLLKPLKMFCQKQNIFQSYLETEKNNSPRHMTRFVYFLNTTWENRTWMRLFIERMEAWWETYFLTGHCWHDAPIPVWLKSASSSSFWCQSAHNCR